MRRTRILPPLLAAILLASGGGARGEDVPPARTEEARRLADLVERLKSADVDVRRQAAAEAKREQAAPVTAALVRLLSDADEKVRLAAVEALGARTDATARKETAPHLAARLPRLARAEQRGERFAVLRALHDVAQPSTLKALGDGIEPDLEPEELALRLRAIANLPCDEAIEWIVRFRAGSGRTGRGGHAYAVRMAREAWEYATGQTRSGNDPDAWRKWWGEHKATWDHKEALARRKAEGGGPAAKPTDATDK